MLYVGKEIIDAVIDLINGEIIDRTYLWTMVGLELGLAVISDLINRGIVLLDSLLGDLFSNKVSEDLIRHAATLDLYQFEQSLKSVVMRHESLRTGFMVAPFPWM